MGRILLTDKFLAGVKYKPGESNEYTDSQVRGLKFRVLESGQKEFSRRYLSPRDGTRARLSLYLPWHLARGRTKPVSRSRKHPCRRAGTPPGVGRERNRRHDGARPDRQLH